MQKIIRVKDHRTTQVYPTLKVTINKDSSITIVPLNAMKEVTIPPEVWTISMGEVRTAKELKLGATKIGTFNSRRYL